ESPRTPSSIYGQNQSALQQRSETPAFPVNSRETPLPFHPLLYQGAITNGTDTYHQNTSMTNRSASPRSMYYGNSRRSSLTSVK
uniref:Uncharacterized protein n=1 Tax=Acrobeloides nanus TaxID=290746 RepID=A0A914D5R6_9BILA